MDSLVLKILLSRLSYKRSVNPRSSYLLFILDLSDLSGEMTYSSNDRVAFRFLNLMSVSVLATKIVNFIDMEKCSHHLVEVPHRNCNYL